MKKASLLLIQLLILSKIGYSQSCLSEGLILFDINHLNEFLEENPNCTCIEGSVDIRGIGTIDNEEGLGFLQIKEIKGDLLISNVNYFSLGKFRFLDSIKYVGGDLKISSIGTRKLNILPNIKEVGGDFEVKYVYYNDNNFNYSAEFFDSFKKLERVGGDFRPHEYMKNHVGFPNLSYIGENCDINYESGFNNFDGLSKLDTVGGNLHVRVWSSLTNANFDHLRYIGGDIWFKLNENLKKINFDSLNYVGGDIRFDDCAILEEPIGMPKLVKLNGDLEFIEAGISEQIATMPELENVGGNIVIRDCEEVINLEGFPKLKVIRGNLDLDSNLKLNSLEGLNSIDSILGDLEMRGSPIKSMEPIGNTIDYLGIIRWTSGLKNFKGLERLKRMRGISEVGFILEDFTGLDSLEYLDFIFINQWSRLKNLKGLETIDSIRAITIKDNEYIESLEGLDGVLGFNWLILTDNPNLKTCASDFICDKIDELDKIDIDNNGEECNSRFKIKDVCKRRYKIFVESFYDLNENGVKEEDEKLISGPLYKIAPQDNYAYFADPERPFLYVGEGEYEVTIDEETFSTWELTSNIEGFTVAVDSVTTSVVIQYGYIPKNFETSSDLQLIATSLRCNTFADLTGNFINNGNTVLSGTNYITSNELVDSITFEIEPDTIITDTIFGWHFQDVFPGYGSKLTMNFKVPGPLEFEIGDKLLFTGYAEYKDQNNNEYNDVQNYAEEIRCSYDPNDKNCTPLYLDRYTLFGEELTYKIRFQNTGNDEAYDIVVRDTLDENLDLSTFKVIASSHPSLLSTQLNRDNRSVAFEFNNIYLPDSTTNEPESHGFIIYNVSPKSSLPEETTIENKAYIYFDFNPPILTNTTENVLVSELPVLGTSKVGEFAINLYPNPVSGSLYFSSSEMIKNVELIDIRGTTILTQDVFGMDGTLNLDNIRQGLYIVKIYTPTGIGTRKIIVN